MDEKGVKGILQPGQLMAGGSLLHFDFPTGPVGNNLAVFPPAESRTLVPPLCWIRSSGTP